MSVEVVLLIVTAALAVVAVAAALVAVRAVRTLRSSQPEVAEIAPDPVVEAPRPTATVPALPAVRVIEGRVIAAPTEQQVVRTALGRPAVRASVYAAGLTHALRPESRDRILAIMRREYRRRRRIRLRFARQAAQSVPPAALHADATWLGASRAVNE